MDSENGKKRKTCHLPRGRSEEKSRKAGGCLTFLLHLTECSTETKGKEKEKGERANKVRFKTFFICSQRREREKREREEKTPMFE